VLRLAWLMVVSFVNYMYGALIQGISKGPGKDAAAQSPAEHCLRDGA
jgi:hypothetical protein